MILLNQQKQFRSLQRLSFCYLCGESTIPYDKNLHDLDHVIAKGIFLENDRNFPLKLPTHKDCNNGLSDSDMALSQIIGLLHDREPSQNQDKRNVRFIKNLENQDEAHPVFSIGDLRTLIFRWVKGCHAALYGEFLPDPIGPRRRSILPPFPMGVEKEAGIYFFDEDFTPQYFEFAKALQKSKLARSMDGIECYNQKFKYYCTWDQLDNGWPFCIFTLDLYDWRRLGSIHKVLPRDCIGAYTYERPNTIPRNAARMTKLDFRIETKNIMEFF